ncbi:MAG: hypothetical protein NC820_03470 [Candidatus Omnitrophica bacterium]|nr:hypothetical protein [Candidatus Omnitrophota bacterium]
MDYLKLITNLRKNKLYLFTLRDIKNLFPQENTKTIKNNLVRWLRKEYFRRVKRDLYEVIDFGEELNIPDLYIANKLYEPSYVSLETKLSIYSIIPEVSAGVTSITTKAIREFKNSYGLFIIYRSCILKAFTGYMIMNYKGFKVKIADREKALVDFLYYRLRRGILLDFKGERFNKVILKKMDWQRLFFYAGLFNEKVLKSTQEFRRFVKC